jgi:hypothetical protein
MSDTLTRLPESERRAIQAELRAWLEELRRDKAAGLRDGAGQTAIADMIGVTQGALSKAIRVADLGPRVRDGVLRVRGVTMPELLAKYNLVSGQMPVVKAPPQEELEKIPENLRSLAAAAVAILLKRGWPEGGAWEALTQVRSSTAPSGPIALADLAEPALWGKRGTPLGRPLDSEPSRPRTKRKPAGGG